MMPLKKANGLNNVFLTEQANTNEVGKQCCKQTLLFLMHYLLDRGDDSDACARQCPSGCVAARSERRTCEGRGDLSLRHATAEREDSPLSHLLVKIRSEELCRSEHGLRRPTATANIEHSTGDSEVCAPSIGLREKQDLLPVRQRGNHSKGLWDLA
jgi:hypothetical protein